MGPYRDDFGSALECLRDDLINFFTEVIEIPRKDKPNRKMYHIEIKVWICSTGLTNEIEDIYPAITEDREQDEKDFALIERYLSINKKSPNIFLNFLKTE